MRRKQILWTVTLLSCILSICGGCLFAQSNPKMPKYNQDNYAKAWKDIDSLDREGLWRSALEQVVQLYERARSENNPSQVVKTLIYRSRLMAQLEEDGEVKAIQQLEKELSGAEFPVQSILQSMLGELYQRYVDQNMWRMGDRTQTAQTPTDDILTWSLERFNQRILELYMASVEPAERLAQVPMATFNEITTKPEQTENLRPTLYDFLAHRAVDQFRNERSYITQPAYSFELREETAFADAAAFAQARFETKDTLSFSYHALLLLQDLIRRHLNDADPAALIDADLKRLSFAHEKAVLENKDSLYMAALERLRSRHAKHPSAAEVDFYLARQQADLARLYHPKTAPQYRDAYKKARQICERAIKAFPKSYGASLCRNLILEIENPRLDIQVEQVNLPGRPILAKVDFRNVAQLHLKVVALSQDDLEELRSQNTQEKIGHLRSLKGLRQWQHNLPQPGDYQPHTTEIALEALPLGAYAVLLGRDRQFSLKEGPTGLLFFYVSNLASLQRLEQDKNQLLVVHRETGAPLSGVKAEFYRNQYDRQQRRAVRERVSMASSNSEGVIRAELPSGNYYQVKLSLGEDMLDTGDGFSNYSSYYREDEVQRQTHFFLDRAIYRPGQTIYFKGIALEQREKGAPLLLRNEPVSITFYDVNRQVVGKVDLRTNDYGSFNGSFQAPQGGLRGAMSLESSIGNSGVSFQVEEYKRPKFQVVFDPLDQDYQLGQEVTVKGKAEAFAGSVVDGAQLQYRVVREVRFPWWPYWRRGFMPPFLQQETEIANGTAITDAEGRFSISFPAIPDASVDRGQQPSFVFTVYADITDITGETQSESKSIQLAYLGLQASVDFPAQIDRTAAPAVQIATSNLNGEPLNASGQVDIYRLAAPEKIYLSRYWETPDMPSIPEAEFRRLFPLFAYAGEDQPENWKRGEKLLDLGFRTDSGKTTLTPDISRLPVGHYELHLTTKDSKGNPIEVKHFFLVYDSQAGKIPANILGWEQAPDKPLQPGETAQVLLASGLDKLQLRYEVERDQEIVAARWVEVGAWQQVPYTVAEADRGNVHLHLTYVRFNRAFSSDHTLQVPWSNKQLSIEYSSFRDKLRPGQLEEWRLKISGPAGERVAAEMVAALYDASLDQFVTHNWNFNPFPMRGYPFLRWAIWGFNPVQAEVDYPPVDPEKTQERSYRELNWFYQYYRYAAKANAGISYRMADSAAPAMAMPEPAMSPGAPPPPPQNMEVQEMAADGIQQTRGQDPAKTAPAEGQLRTNLKETVFFLPELRTDEQGNVIISFTMNEALTRWKFLGMAHSKDLQYVLSSREIVTQKELMVLPNPPRFLREGDEVEFTAKVSNLTPVARKGTATLELFDALTGKPVDAAFGNERATVSFDAPASQSARVSWKLKVPAGAVSVLTHRITAKADAFSDGEENALPVLSNRMLITESMPMPVRGKTTKTFTFRRLGETLGSETLQAHSLALEFTSNPAWYAVKSLPYLMEYPHECAEQVFSRLYANALAGAVVDQHPKIKDIFERWRKEGGLKSDLMRNEELKAVLLQETPWVLEAQSEEEQRKNLAILFDLERMQRERETALRKLIDQQMPSGGFAWFPGGHENWFITQYIVEGMGRLQALGIKNPDEQAIQMTLRAIAFVDQQLQRQYEELKKLADQGKLKLADDHLNQLVIHYLYARSFFPQVDREASVNEAYLYYREQAEKYWLDKGIYEQGLIALGLHRDKRTEPANRIVRSLRERALQSEELGMYWKYERGWFWHQLPIETHSLMMEVFAEVARDAKALDELRVWLLKNKQTNHWPTTKATAAAVYALFLEGEGLTGKLLADGQQVDIQFPELRKKQYRPALETAAANAEAGTGYFKVAWEGEGIRSGMDEVKVSNPNSSIAWGSMYWQYFEDLDKITTFEETPLKLRKGIFRQDNSDRGPELTAVAPGVRLTPGDLLIVRIELRVDRDMEFVHMKDLRASGLEPVEVLSRYKWQGGLGYYESPGDAATHFFFDYLPRGTYVFEYPLRVNLQGDFSNGVTIIQSMYAPEFTSHSEGVRVRVQEEEN